jgi:hypothetical protein
MGKAMERTDWADFHHGQLTNGFLPQADYGDFPETLNLSPSLATNEEISTLC